MDAADQYARLHRADRAFGDAGLDLVIGGLAIRVEGLDEGLHRDLLARWGGFARTRAMGSARATVQVRRGGAGHWLDAPRAAEPYRIEAVGDGARRIVSSYHFAIGRDSRPHGWRLGISDRPDEPLPRILDNALRFVTARVAVDEGGFAMHAAGVLREGRAYLFAGPSRAGKSTVLRMLAPAPSLGDDFGLVLPGDGGWRAPAVPFDNSERATARPVEGLLPVAGIWRLFQSQRTHVESPPGARAVASLMGCVAFPWTMPECAAALLEHVSRFVGECRFAHLHFSIDAPLGPHLD